MFEESKQRLLNGVSSMAREMKSPKISKHVPPFVHAVINPNRNRKEGSTPRSVYYTILVSTNASPPPKKKKKKKSSLRTFVYRCEVTHQGSRHIG